MLKKKKSVLFIPLAIILLLILIIPPHTLVSFKNGGIIFFKTPLYLSWRMCRSLLNVKEMFTFISEYRRMRNELEKLRFSLNQLKEEKLENVRLRQILRLQEKEEFNFVVAQVIAKEPTNWLNSLIIDKGRDEGLTINQPVMNFSGLIGKIVEIGPGTAKVLLISDVNSRVVTLVQRTRQEGILEGTGRGLCRLKYLPIDADVELGDVVVSAGVGGVYPKGLVIGSIESIRIQRGGIYKSCIVQPAVPLSGLEEVLCLK